MLTHGRKLSSIVLVLLLICTAVSVSTPQNALAATDEPQKVREITELRESDSKTYQLSDGTYEWVGYPEDVHYLDQNGDYQDISNSIILENKKIGDVDYGYKNKANKYTVRFATNASDANLVMMDYQDKSIAFGLVDTKASNAVKTEKIDSKILSDMVDTQSCVEYKDIYQDVDLMYESKTYGVKEYIILNQPTDKNEFYFNIMLDGLTVKEDNGNVIFVDKNGKTVFEAGKLFAVDNNGAVTEDVKCVAMENNGSYQLKVTVDKSYLADANRAYPIIIDPSVMITGSSVTFDSYVSSRNGDANYYLSDYIKTGRDSNYYTMRTYIRFNLPTNIPAGYVTSAYLRIKKYSGATPVVTAYRVLGSWASSTITWNNMPGYTTTYASTTAINDSGYWWSMYATTMVSKWLDGTYSNYGFCVRDATESGTSQWTIFYSSDAPSPNKPELHIEYIAPVDITSVDPNTGYLTQDPYTIKAWVTGGTNPTVTFRYPASGTIKLSATLNYGGSYYSANITPNSSNYTSGVYSGSLWSTPYGLFSASSSGYTDTYLSSMFICVGSLNDYSSTDSTFYYSTPSNNSFRGVSTYGNVDNYNCLAYAVNVNNDWMWPWGETNPLNSELNDFMSKSGNYSSRAGTAYTPSNAYSYPKVIYYSDYDWGTGGDGHFSKVVSWDSNGHPLSIYSKWGSMELIYSSNGDPFISGYGAAKAYYE